jgi:mycothiol synthase
MTEERRVVSSPTQADDDDAAAAGLRSRRDLFELRRPLPVEAALHEGLPPITTRAFRLGEDEDAWLEVNNRSFASHPDQSNQTRADLEAQEREPWFDPEGFLLLDGSDGRLDGFCWTKVHADHDPPLGEIYVIGVDPSAHGRGLGGALTIAGLDHLAARGLTVGMLYVDESNTPARKMYARLGFTEHHRDRVYTP